MQLFIGLMSGTSLDGVDAVLVDFSSGTPQTLATVWLPYPTPLRDQALRLQSAGSNELHIAALLANDLAQLYAHAVENVLAKAHISPEQVTAIGCHGQTVRHQPNAGYSLQLNNPALLAELIKITVVADFRSRDIAAGGQGAPLVPAFHAEVFSSSSRHRVILNIGGFANLTDLNPEKPIQGFDCGPGNVLMDAWIDAIQGIQYDKGGSWASQGVISPSLLEKLMADKFFHSPPPKSCGRDGFNMPWLSQFLDGGERPEDVQATLAELTALISAQAIQQWCGHPDEVFVCGGGVHNATLMARLQHHLPHCRIASTDFLGQPPDWVEAVAFAWLAWRAISRQPGNLPAVTGAHGPRILGAIYPA
ncbi:anhydro-N-acetylmuramic acid kinase [Rugosibacter aromaticivorans]|nr:anhydro-N-acetylmuramic acid kinase [Rugosibacter aromaticivorans]